MPVNQPSTRPNPYGWLLWIVLGLVIANHALRLTTGGGEVGHLKAMTADGGNAPQDFLYTLDRARRKAGSSFQSLQGFCPSVIEEACVSFLDGVQVVAGLH